MFRRDWSRKPNAEAYYDLVFRQWWTNADGSTDGEGLWNFRAMQGEYELEVTSSGVTKTLPVVLPPAGQTVTVIFQMN